MHLRRVPSTTTTLLFALTLVACGGRLDDPSAFRQTSAAIDVEGELLPTSCGATAGCHAAEGPAVGLDLVSPGVAARLLDVTSVCNGRLLVESGGGASYFLEKVTESMPECGLPMPATGALTVAELDAIAAWVAEIATSSTSTTSP